MIRVGSLRQTEDENFFLENIYVKEIYRGSRSLHCGNWPKWLFGHERLPTLGIRPMMVIQHYYLA